MVSYLKCLLVMREILQYVDTKANVNKNHPFLNKKQMFSGFFNMSKGGKALVCLKG